MQKWWNSYAETLSKQDQYEYDLAAETAARCMNELYATFTVEQQKLMMKYLSCRAYVQAVQEQAAFGAGIRYAKEYLRDEAKFFEDEDIR